MMQNHTGMFLAAMELLIERSQVVRNKLAAELQDNLDDYLEDDELDAFDEAVGIMADARNEFCQENERATEDLVLHWEQSEVQRVEAQAEANAKDRAQAQAKSEGAKN
jgi:hypothetical protein